MHKFKDYSFYGLLKHFIVKDKIRNMEEYVEVKSSMNHLLDRVLDKSVKLGSIIGNS